MQSLLRACMSEHFPAVAACVISNRPDAAGLQRAQEAGVDALAIDHRGFPDRLTFERSLHEALEARHIDLVALAGFMRVLTPWFVERWTGRLINIHPSLLPLYPGLDTHRRALASGDLIHGCTVHHVTAGVDEGTVIGQARVCVRADDSADSLAERVLIAEHLLYPRCLAAVARGSHAPTVTERVTVDGVTIEMDVPSDASA
jgi:phosphoribosylglycinamide formyltransferase-1